MTAIMLSERIRIDERIYDNFYPEFDPSRIYNNWSNNRLKQEEQVC